MPDVTIIVNGKREARSVEARTLLVHFLREQLALTGTHVGCDTSQCGACVIHLDGRSVKSCAILAVQADGSEITAIEGIGTEQQLHPMQEAFREHHALQCGFCTPGMIMRAIDLASRLPEADETTVRHELEGNFCRCTGYQNIVSAILAGADAMRNQA